MRILFFALILCFIYAFITPSFGQEISNSFSSDIGSFYSDQTEYEVTRSSNTLIKIHGVINDVSRASKVVIMFTLPDGSKTGNHVFTTDVGEFETLFPINYQSQKGDYSAFISHDGTIIGQIGFVVKEKSTKSPFESEPSKKKENQTSVSPEETPTELHEEEPIMEIPKDEGSYELQDGTLIYYLVTNGKLINMDIDKDTSTLSSEINFFGEGAITVGIPRYLLDARENNQDVNFLVYLNGNPVDYENVVTNEYDRVIMINTEEGFSQIEIIGISTAEPTQEEPSTVEPPAIIKNTLRVHVSDIPTWSNNIDDTITESLNYWEIQYPNLQFEQVGENEPQDFFVYWVKEFGVEHVGYAYGNKFLEVGLGDSGCRGKWNQYSPNHIGAILKHEIGHIIGLEHNPDPNSIMYPVAQNHEYGLESEEFVMTSGYGQYIPLCTIKDSTSYDIEVTTDDPAHGFNVYVVSSEQQFNNFIEGNTIEHFKNNECYKENTLNFKNSCNVSKGNGILLTINDEQTNNLTNIKLTLKEKSKPTPEPKTNTEQNNDSPDKVPTEIKVKSQYNSFKITSVQVTDPQGNPSSLQKGEIGFIKVNLDASKAITTLVTVNLFDSDLTSIGIGSIKTTLSSGNSEIILSFMIPGDVAIGSSNVYVNAFSDWPSNGGIPLTGEVSVTEDIE